ncbi:MAG: (2Fe-2S)-binding protein [Xanthomonadales bacterium]|nr:(2Fe-2S)-binding protein [Xanthomonadales bacterium]NNL96560.1 (2Fe-2S)-binding protein [Xanthomonadales bacterium]
MYVCLCHSVTDSDIHDAVADGVRNLKQLSAETGCASGCGSCRDMAAEVLKDSLREQRNFLSVVTMGSAA